MLTIRRTFVGLVSRALCAVLCLGVTAAAQATSGSILGRVADAQDAVVANATVSVANEGTGFTQEVTTSADGDFSISNLPPGLYTVTVTGSGFKKSVQSNVKLSVDQKLRIDVALEPGGVSEVVEVTSDATVLQTQSTETGEVIQSRQILELPLLGRNFLELTNLTPGVTTGDGGNNVNRSVNGQREFANSILVDGVEVTGNRNNDTSLRPSVDAVEEFKIVTSGYAPEFGRAAGGVITIQTKSGSNDFHGSLYEFYRPRQTAARTFFSQEGSHLRQSNFGASIGGPIVKDKTFFFFSYEGFRLRDSFNFLDTVPRIDQIRYLANGDVDLSGLRDPNTGNTIPIFDPLYYAVNFTPLQFPGNIIPADRVSPAGRAILQNFFPLPNAPGIFNGYFNNFFVDQSYRFDSDTYDTRVDHTFSDNDRLAGVFHSIPFDSLQGDRYAGAIPIEGGGDADDADRSNSLNQSLSITETHVFSNGWVNEARFGYNRFKFDQFSLLDGQNLADQFGIANVNIPGFPATSGFPYIGLGSGARTGGSTYKPLRFLDSNFQLSDNFLFKAGRHDFKVGGDFRFLSSRPNFSLLPTTYQYYAGAYASLTSDPSYTFFDPAAYFGNGGSEIADLLLGLPYIVDRGIQFTDPRVRSHEVHFYGQDTWQITDRLVLNYGVRYEYQAPYVENDDQISNYDISTGQILIAGRGGNSRSLLAPDRNNLAPRVGLAYRIGDSTVIRGAFGIFYTPENDARNDVLTKNYPFAIQQDFLNDINGFYGAGFPTYQLDTGIPVQTVVPVGSDVASIDPTTIPGAANQSFFALDPNFRTGYAESFNLILQHELSANWSVEVGYVGTLGRKLPYAVGDLNFDKRLAPALGSINAQFPIGLSNYHSLQAKLNRRFANGFNILASYTFAKSIDNGPAPFNLGRNNQLPQDPYNLTAERAVSSNDARHNLVVSGIYELPFGKGKPFFGDAGNGLDAVVGGWQVSGIYAARSGLPVNVVRGIQTKGYEGLRPNVVGDPNLDSGQTLDHWFDTDAFNVDGLGPLEPGSAGRNIVRGPHYGNLDFSLFKSISLAAIREGVGLQLRFEFYNITNTPHFGRPNADFIQGGFGTITGTIGNPRIVQFAAKLNF